MKHLKFYLIAALAILLTTGCLDVNRDFREIRNDVLSQIDCKIKKDTELGLGRGMIGMAQNFISFTDDPDAELADEILDEIKKIQVGTYKLRRFDASLKDLSSIQYNLEDKGWDLLVKEKRRGEFVLMMQKGDYDNLNELLIININHHECDIVQVAGRLDRVIELAMEDEIFYHKSDHVNIDFD